jgi:hypothetical protein
MTEFKQPLECASLPAPEAPPTALAEQYQALLAESRKAQSTVQVVDTTASAGWDRTGRIQLTNQDQYLVAWPGPGTAEQPEAIAGSRPGLPSQEDHYAVGREGSSRKFVSWGVDRNAVGLNITAQFEPLNGSMSEQTAKIYDKNNHLLGSLQYTFNPDGTVTSCSSSSGNDREHATRLLWTANS